MKEENIISNIVLGICTILLLVLVFSNVYAFFPALTNSLGTLSDWFMVLITAITAVFLYKTLQSQMEVQKDQEKINKLNSYDIRYKFLPKIESDATPIPESDLFYNNQNLRQLFFKVKDHDAKYVKIKSTLEFTPYYEGEIFLDDGLYCQKISMIKQDSIFYLLIDKKNINFFLESSEETNKNQIDFIHYAQITFEYEDNFGFKYHKSFQYDYQPFTKLINIRESNIHFT